MNVIWAVTQANQNLYNQLKEALPDVSSSVGVLANDSSNVVSETINQTTNGVNNDLLPDIARCDKKAGGD